MTPANPAHKKNTETFIIVGIAIAAVVVVVVLEGQHSSSSVAFSAPNPQSVAAVEEGIGAQIAAYNQAGVQKSQIAAQTILGLAQSQNSLQLGQLQAADALAATQAETQSQTLQAELQNQASIQNTAAASAAAVKIADQQAQASIAAANAQAQAQNYATGSAVSIADAQLHTQQQSSLWNGILGTIGGIFGFNPGAPSNAGIDALSPLPATNGENVYDYGGQIAPVQYAGVG